MSILEDIESRVIARHIKRRAIAEKEVEDIYYNIIAEILHEREIGPKALNEMIEDEETLKELVICKAKRKLDKTLIKMCDKIDIKHINLKWGLSGAGLVALGKFMEIDPLAYVGIGITGVACLSAMAHFAELTGDSQRVGVYENYYKRSVDNAKIDAMTKRCLNRYINQHQDESKQDNAMVLEVVTLR